MLYAARTWHALGFSCRVVSSAAAGDSREIERAFPADVELILAPAPRTTEFENAYSSDGARTQRAGALAPALAWSADHLDGIDLVQLGPLHPDDLQSDWYRPSSAPHALDLQGFTRCVRGGAIAAVVDPRTAEYARGAAWVKASVREWRLIETALPALARGPGSEWLCTRGIEGGDVFGADGRSAWRPDPPVSGCDPTGAGDVFFASFLAHRIGGATAAAAVAFAARFTSRFLATRA